MVVPQLWWFDLCCQLWVDVVTVTDVVHPAATTRDDSLNLLSLVHLGRLIPIWSYWKVKVVLEITAQGHGQR